MIFLYLENSGFRRDKDIANKFMNIPNDDNPNFPFSILKLVDETLNTQLNELTNQIL